MSDEIAIEHNEGRRIRVFAVNRASEDMQAALRLTPKADVARDLLDDPHLNTKSTELFPVSDLEGLGLGAYLSEGYAVDEDAVAEDRAKLDSLDGYVMLLFSDSFGGADATLRPGQALTLIGTYDEYTPDIVTASLTADSALPYTGVPGVVPRSSAQGAAGSALVLLAGLTAFALILWWVFG